MMDGERSGMVQVGSLRFRTAAEVAAALDVVEGDLGRDLDTSLAVTVEAEAAAGAFGDEELAMRARLLKADISERKGYPARVVDTLWTVNRWAADHDCRPLLVRSHLLLARTYRNLGGLSAYLDHAVSAVEASGPDAPADIRARCLRVLADALKWNGSRDAARERYRQAEQVATAGGCVEVAWQVLNNLASCELEFGEPERAWAAVERLHALAADRPDLMDPVTTETIARVEMALGRYTDAERRIEDGIRQYHVRGFELTHSYAEQALTLATARRHLGDTRRARQALDRCRQLCAEHGYTEVAIRAQQELAELHAASGDYQAAFEAHKAFYADAEELRSQQREAQARNRHAMFETAEASQNAERFREQARRDPLTGLRNRRYVDEHLPALINEARTRAQLTVAMIDLDHFKQINDTLSHDAGDRVLVAVADLLEKEATAGFAARLGGEEFLLVLPGTALADAVHQLEELRIAIGSHDWRPVTGGLPVTVSIGAASTEDLTPDRASQSTLLAEADRNLYSAKHRGRNRVVTHLDPDGGDGERAIFGRGE
jgi:diguanylate cyclase (GGDEF)-like protein